MNRQEVLAAVAPHRRRALGRRRLSDVVSRGFDILVALAALVCASPVLLAAMAGIVASDPGPVFFRQVRIGRDGRPFRMIKLRSMYRDAEARKQALVAANVHGAAGVTFKMRNDPRIFPVGRLIRRFSIDELPQFWNILMGDMAVVGPRPAVPAEVARYTPFERQRLAVKPGLTCFWQVQGRADIPFDRQVLLDLDYVHQRGLGIDIGLVFKTVPAVLGAKGAY